jgi:hypothetical protein
VFLHNKLNDTNRQKLSIGLCEDPCFYERFRDVAARMSTPEFDAFCKDTTGAGSTLYGSIASKLQSLK